MEVTTKKEKPIEVRYALLPEVHEKINAHRRRLSAERNKDATMEEACNDFIIRAQIK